MIAREWRCRCPRATCDSFLEHMRRTGVQDAKATPGLLGELVLQRELPGDRIEITLVTFWSCLEDVAAFAGKNISAARLYPDDEAYGIEPDSFVTHHLVVEHELRQG